MQRSRLALLAGAATLGVSAALLSSPALAASHGPKPESIAINAHRHRVPANGTATSRVVVKLRRPRGGTDGITLSDVASVSGSCGNLSASSGNANRAGRLVVTYTASSTVGFCTITASAGSASASVTVDQVDPTLAASDTRYSISSAANPTSLKPDGTSTSQITVTVLDGASAVPGDSVLGNERALRRGSCGTLSAGGVTDGSGQFVFTYQASTSRGNCFLRFSEASTGASTVVVLHQTSH